MIFDIFDRFRERQSFPGTAAENVIRQTLRRFSSDPGQSTKFINQLRDTGTIRMIRVFEL
jgi:hypothetical protein